MRIFVIALSVLFFVTVPTMAEAQETAFAALRAAKSLDCVFRAGTRGEWVKGKVTTKRATDSLQMHIESIDLEAGKARLIGNISTADVSATLTPRGLNLFETTGTGSGIYTTVFAAYQPGVRRFVAVTSRHVAFPMGALPVVAQYYGTCEAGE